MRIKILLLIAALGSAASAATLAAETTNPPAPAKFAFSANSPQDRAPWQKRLALGPGDVLNFTLYDKPETAVREVPIGPDGRVSYLQAEDILATGLTIEELRAQFDRELSKFYSSVVTVITPEAYNSKKYYLLGAVNRKGVYQLNRPTTLIEALAQAGGLETGVFEQNTVEMADLARSFAIRDGQRLAVDFQRLFQQGDLSQNIALAPNDYVFFAASGASQIFVVGAVGGQGVLPHNANATVISAITARGGFADKAYQSKVLVIRGSLNAPETFVVDAKAILAGEQPDFRLQPKDIVYVSRRPWARVEEILDNATIAFVQSAVVTWTGLNVGPIIKEPIDD
jgi:protein involved in polysaccharide export with SLBB domain